MRKHYTALPLFGSWNVLALQSTFLHLGFCLGFLWSFVWGRSSAWANLRLVYIPAPMLCPQGIPYFWECDAVHTWVKAGAEKLLSEVATPSLLDRAGLESSLGLKQFFLRSTNDSPKAQSCPEWLFSKKYCCFETKFFKRWTGLHPTFIRMVFFKA